MPREVDEPPSEDSDLDQALTNLQFSLGTQPQSAAVSTVVLCSAKLLLLHFPV